MLCGGLDERRVWGRMDACVCVAESLCCADGAIPTLLINYIPKQNIFFNVVTKILIVLMKRLVQITSYAIRVRIHHYLFSHNHLKNRINS